MHSSSLATRLYSVALITLSLALICALSTACGSTVAIAFSSNGGAAVLFISASSSVAAEVGTKFNTTLQASGGTAPYSFATVGTSSMAGVALAANGTTATLSGTPTHVGDFPLTVKVTDSANTVVQKTLNIAVAPALAITTRSLPLSLQNMPYPPATIATSGGIAPLSFALASGALPAGLTLSQGGSLSGTPSVAGNFSFTVKATDAAGASSSQAFTLYIAPGLAIATPTLPTAKSGAPYNQTLAATGGTPPYTWTAQSGSLPSGISLNSATGTLTASNVSAADGSYPVSLQARDSADRVADRSLAIVVQSGVVAIQPATAPGASVGNPYTFTFTPLGGTAPYSWSIASGAFPPGLSLDTSFGQIYGPAAATPGEYVFTAQVTDANGNKGLQPFAITVANTAPYGNVGDPYEGAIIPPAADLRTCQSIDSPGLYRLASDLTAANGTGTCITISAENVTLDLAGHTVNGRVSSVYLGEGPFGLVIFNGAITCNFANSTTDSAAGCIHLENGPVAFGAPVRLHHLTLSNTADSSVVMKVDWHLKAAPPVTSIKLDHLTVIPPLLSTNRASGLSVNGSGQNVEYAFIDETCGDVRACEQLICFGVNFCSVHDNKLTMTTNTGANSKDPEPGRAILIDGNQPVASQGTLGGEIANNIIIANNNRAIRVRNSTRLDIHDNYISRIFGIGAVGNQTNYAGAIHLGDPDAGLATNDMQTTVHNNVMEFGDGTPHHDDGRGFYIRDASSLKIFNNILRCTAAKPCNGSLLGAVRGSQAISGSTDITFADHPGAAALASPQIIIDSGGSRPITVHICDSGVANFPAPHANPTVDSSCP